MFCVVSFTFIHIYHTSWWSCNAAIVFFIKNEAILPVDSSDNALSTRNASNNMTPEVAAGIPIEKSKCILEEPITPLRRKARITNLRLKAVELMATSPIEPAALIPKTPSAVSYGFGVLDHQLASERAADSARGKQ